MRTQSRSRAAAFGSAIEGSEARLGSREFCGVAARDPRGIGSQDGLSMIAFAHAGREAIFAFRQRIRPDAAAVVAALRAHGLDVRILSGDRASAVAPVAAALGLQDWIAELKPAGKIAAIERLKAQGRRILMVGDGLNDAPALAAAHVSMSPISAADITQAQADAVFLGERLLPGARGRRVGARRQALDDAESLAGRDLQHDRGADRDRGLCHAAHRRARHVGIIVPGHAQCLARQPPPRQAPARRGRIMNVLVYLVPVALGLGLAGLAAFLWSLRSGQYDDMEGAALRILPDDDLEE